jgi:hypothetical protein
VPDGVTVDWYDVEFGGEVLIGGANTNSYWITTPAPGEYTYYAEAVISNTGCTSTNRTAVTLTVFSASECLRIELMDGEVRLTWTGELRLFAATQLGFPQNGEPRVEDSCWRLVVDGVAQSNGENSVTLPLGEERRFFILSDREADFGTCDDEEEVEE